MRIIVDQDEVMAQFVEKVLHRWNAINGTNFVRNDVNCWRMEEVLGVDTLGRSAEGLIDEWLAEPGFFESLEPVRGAIDGFNSLRRNHDVVIATSVPEVATNAYDGKRRWMRKFFPDWSMKNFICISRKELIAGDILIDDAVHNIVGWIDRKYGAPIVFDAPWNKDLERSPAFNGKFFRAQDWEEVLRLVELIDMYQSRSNKRHVDFSEMRTKV